MNLDFDFEINPGGVIGAALSLLIIFLFWQAVSFLILSLVLGAGVVGLCAAAYYLGAWAWESAVDLLDKSKP